uniref:Uncharacterized protein n=1 Tax=Meloidogyne enterolobii TaxID=390850 RepID=A0A6V7V1W8_MELEN|nr:unnamed protein product [Meloidogyne enterolobii]
MTETQEKQLYNEGEEDTRCAVCSDQAQGLHFGVMVCRACAAFFRRSTIAKRVYQCRYSGNCQINFREVRCSCRACRFARCISLGMDPNAVQKHRDQLGPRKIPTEKGKNNSTNKIIKKQQIKNEENNNFTTNSSLLTPINIMNAMQLQLNNKLIEEKSCSTNNFLHLEENGRSYTLLNGQLNNDNSYLIENNKNSFTDTLLQALPSAFSPIQKQQQSSPTDITTTTTTLDSGNVSATSSVFSSPLNPGSANGHTNHSPSSNILSMISPQTSESWLYNNPTSTSYINILNTCCSSSDNYSLDKSTNYYPSLNEMLKGYLKLENKNYSYKKDENEGEKEIMMKEGNYTENVDSIKAESFSVSEMIEEHFFRLLNSNNFNSDTRWTMLRNFFFPFVLAYRSFISSKCFPNPEDTRLIATPGKTFFDVCNLQRFFNVEQCLTDPESIAQIFAPTFRYSIIIKNSMSKLCLTELEFAGLLGLLFWNDKIENLNDEERSSILKIRKQIFEELYILCKNNSTKSEDLSIRYCTIINYFHFYQVKFKFN